jgi:hypothetical protein
VVKRNGIGNGSHCREMAAQFDAQVPIYGSAAMAIRSEKHAFA